MKTVKKGVLFDMMEQLGGYCFKECVDIPEWETYDGDYLGNGEYRFYENEKKTVTIGDSWLARYDCARMFIADVILPESFADKRVFLDLDFGGEITVRINSRTVNSLSSGENRGWVARSTVPMRKEDLSFGKPMRVELEANVDSAAFCDDAMAGAKNCRYTLKRARFICADEPCMKFYLDCKLIRSALDVIKDEFIKERVYRALDDALHMVDYDFDDEEVRRSIEKAGEYLDSALSKIDHTPSAEVIMDGHSHIDVAWLWRIQESERKSLRTFINTLSLMDIYPEYTFTQSQAIVYDMIKKNAPDVFERIKEKVKNGQWNIVGNTWVECDTNIASGESMIRQLLYGREFFLKEFGVSSDIYWLPDCFGFSWALPQIIKRSGMKYFITTKLLNQDTNRFPHTLFRWRGADSSEILALNQRSHYQGEYDPDHIVRAAFNNDDKDVFNTAFGMFGYGDGGGGSTYRMLENAKRLKNFPGLPSSRMGHPQEYFEKTEKIRDELPVYCDELYYENHRGTYTSQAFIKKGNRKCEFLLCHAEEALAFGGGYNREKLEELWKKLLKNQFHDILPGTSIHEAIEDCRKDFGELLIEGAALFDSAVEKLNSKVSLSSDGVIVWNFTSHEMTCPVTLETENEVEAVMRKFNKDGRKYIEFIAENVPPMGFCVIKRGKAKNAEKIRAEKGVLENEYLRVTYDEDGILLSVFDKENSRETLSGEGNRLSIFTDKCIHETAWNLEKNYQKREWILRSAESVEITEANEVRAVVRIRRRFNKSFITQDMILYRGSRQLVFETEVDWQERDKILKAAFDVDVLASQATFEAAHSAIERPVHRNSPFDAARFEQCAHKWADLSEGDYGVSILNDCKYGYDIEGSRMRISLMRAPTCPDRLGDLGVNTFIYSFYPHSGTWQTADTVNEAFKLNVGLRAYERGAQNGSLGDRFSFIEVSDDLIVDAFKQAQDGRGRILRFYESRRVRGKRTVKLNMDFEKIIECDLMETDEKEIEVNGNSFETEIRPFEVRTFRII